MDQVPEDLLPQSDQDKFLHLPHNERWEKLKPIVVRLYLGGSATIDQIAKFMRARYSFHAASSEYPHRFRAWNVRKRVVKEDKADITNALGRRKRPGTSTSNVMIEQNGKEIPLDTKKLRRFLNDQKRRGHVLPPMSPGLLTSWNLPYSAYISSLLRTPDKPSPFGPLGATPGHINVHSPETSSPGRAANNPSPNMQLVYEKARNDRASLFMQGRNDELIINLCDEDRRVFIDYFHDFYLHGFIMAKYWGQEIPPDISFPASASTPQGSSPAMLHDSSPGRSQTMTIVKPPTMLCRWTIHVESEQLFYDETIENLEQQPNEDNPGSPSPSFDKSLHESMVSNSFTSTPAANLPIALETIVESLANDQTALRLDAWKLAIVSGKYELLESWLEKREKPPDGIDTIYPFHLVASFLDGGNTCCKVFETLSMLLGETYAFYHNVDDLGHTILDALMISIVRSHTRLSPLEVSTGFRSHGRFPGEEKDICGRWDVDTPAVRHLLQQGHARIPNRWKHVFCHTAAQAVCHSIIAIFGSPASPDVNTLSGLFGRRCMECGLGLSLRPLHTLVVVAFYLAQMGMPGETLFGVLAVMVCLIALGADVSLKTNTSVEDIQSIAEAGMCYHRLLSARELMMDVPSEVVQGWSDSCQTGWSCLMQTLAISEPKTTTPDNDETSQPADEEDESSGLHSDKDSYEKPCELWGEHEEWLKLPCIEPQIGLLWAMIQTELLTYRRVEEGDGWISENFSMNAVNVWLRGGSSELDMPLVSKMAENHSRCGWFHNTEEVFCPTASKVCNEHFMNMNMYTRASFVGRANFWELWEGVLAVKDGGV